MDTPFNLLQRAWIPVLRESGAQEMIAPSAITSSFDEDPIISIDSPRPDLDGAYLQFLIALIQTTLAPSGKSSEWWDRLTTPPRADELEAAFEPIIHAFDLDGDGPCFMQELEDFKGGSVPITDLFINAPGDNTRNKNADFFVKRTDDALGDEAIAIALFLLQTNAYGGGPGYRTSIRGGGPLTTVVLGPTLWQTIWANILDAEDMGIANGLPKDLSTIFAWLAPTRLSKGKTGVETTPEDCHPLHVYWAMPWRIRLDEVAIGQPCSLYPNRQATHTTFKKTNYGTNYTGLWEHPLTPYRTPSKKDKSVEFISLKATSRNVRYSNWPNIALVRGQRSDEQRTARVFRALAHHRLSGRQNRDKRKQYPWLSHDRRAWVFGYEMDNAKTLQWHEAKGPLLIAPEEHKVDFEALVENLIKSAEYVEDILYQSVQKMLGRKVLAKNGIKVTWSNADHAPDRTKSIMSATLDEFWANTTSDFHDTIDEALRLFASGEANMDALSERWLARLHEEARDLFEKHAPQDVTQLKNMRAVVFARSELTRWTHPHGKKLRGILDLPEFTPSQRSTS